MNVHPPEVSPPTELGLKSFERTPPDRWRPSGFWPQPGITSPTRFGITSHNPTNAASVPTADAGPLRSDRTGVRHHRRRLRTRKAGINKFSSSKTFTLTMCRSFLAGEGVAVRSRPSLHHAGCTGSLGVNRDGAAGVATLQHRNRRGRCKCSPAGFRADVAGQIRRNQGRRRRTRRSPEPTSNEQQRQHAV